MENSVLYKNIEETERKTGISLSGDERSQLLNFLRSIFNNESISVEYHPEDIVFISVFFWKKRSPKEIRQVLAQAVVKNYFCHFGKFFSRKTAYEITISAILTTLKLGYTLENGTREVVHQINKLGELFLSLPVETRGVKGAELFLKQESGGLSPKEKIILTTLSVLN